MNRLNNVKTGVKLVVSFLIVAAIIAVVAVVGYINMQNISEGTTSLYFDRTIPIQQVGNASMATYAIRGDVFKYMLVPTERKDTLKTLNDNIATVNSNIEKYRSTQMSQEEKEALAAFDKDWSEYQAAFKAAIALTDAGKDQEALQSVLTNGRTSNARKAVGVDMDKITAINNRIAGEINDQSKTTLTTSTRLLIIFTVLGVFMAVAMGIGLTGTITRPLSILVMSARALSTGDTLRDMDEKLKDSVRQRRDEIGAIGKAFDGLINYMQEMGKAATTIAQNDLTVSVLPKSERDELGNAFQQMVASLKNAVGQVQKNATAVEVASRQLAQAANQTGQAIGQISQTVQQVAKGTSDSTQAIARTASSVEQMSRAIDGVAKGAGDQGVAVAKASGITAQLSTTIEQVAGNAAAVMKDSASAAEAARKGEKTVEETLEGMQQIRVKVGVSSEKVTEMGRRSGEIGAIVEAIEDIASQTNLLALNAAIEAARAGEHGKGFAVVADEVRKLSERASQATKEIGGLIKGIQRTVAEAIKAMEEGNQEVEAGVKKANQAGTALSDILAAADAVSKQASSAAQASQRMTSAAGELVTSIDSVSAVIEENTAATEQMAANSGEVTQAIESIASVSEENSAAIEEVSASTEEMNAQVEEVAASAQSLAGMARALQAVTAQFKLSA